MLVLSGVPGSGKSFYAAHLRDDHGWRFVKTDRLDTDADEVAHRWERVLTLATPPRR